MQLDLRFNGELDKSIALIYNKIADNSRESFNKMISEIAKPFKHNLDWWFEGPASRNTLVSPLFHYYVSFNLVIQLVENEQYINDILVDSLAFSKILKKYLKTEKKFVNVRNEKDLKTVLLKKTFNPALKVSYELFRWSLRLLLAKKSKEIKKSIPENPVTLIDVYAIKGFISKDRYYNGLWENLNDEQKRQTYFAPQIVNMSYKHLKLAYLEIRRSQRNFLIKEDYLKFADIVFSVMHFFRLKKLKIVSFRIHNIDFSPMIKEELMSLKGYSAAVVSFLNYRFAKRILENNIKLRLIIDWFENQVFDKGWNAGFNTYYPSIDSIGYRGYIPAQNSLSSFPTVTENDNKLLPKQIAVIGDGFKDSLRDISSRLRIVTAPAFRFRHIWKHYDNKPDSDYYTILIALSIMLEESITILKLVNKSLRKHNIKNLRVWVKPHPTTSVEKIKNHFGNVWPRNFEFINGVPGDSISKSNILISGMSSICLETISLGIPVIMIERLSGLSYNPIPKEIPQDLWKLCNTSDEIRKSILFFEKLSVSELKIKKDKGKEIKKKYFEPTTHQSVQKFLQFE